MPRKAVGRQPPQEGPAWQAFMRYWKHAIDDNGRRAAAWRAFHAGYHSHTPTPEEPRGARRIDG